jgi:hypothetical protein
MSDTSITIGDTVKSYDFPDREDRDSFYVLGKVVDFHHGATCTSYVISVEKRVWKGSEETPRDEKVFVPINGTTRMLDEKKTSGVVRVYLGDARPGEVV